MARVNFEKKGNIGYVVLDNPPVNAMSNEMYQEIADTFHKIETMDDIFVVILRSAGKVFCAGNEVGEFATNFTSRTVVIGGADAVTNCAGAIFGCSKPVIAAVNGHAIGAGFVLSASSDFIIAGEKVLFGTPEVKLGVIAATAFPGLILPTPVARYMGYTGENLTAEQMLQYGAVLKVVPKDQVLAEAEALADKLIKTGPVAVGLYKKSFNENMNPRLREKYFNDVTHLADYYNSHDFKEAVAAFMEKRPAKFTGK